MFKLTIKELVAHKLRMLTTAFAVLLGVAFMAGTLVFTDTISATFDSALGRCRRGSRRLCPYAVGDRPRLRRARPASRRLTHQTPSLRSTVSTRSALRINGYAQLVDRDGDTVGDLSKNPAFGTNWVTVDDLNPYELVERSCAHQRWRDRHRQGERRQGRLRAG